MAKLRSRSRLPFPLFERDGVLYTSENGADVAFPSTFVKGERFEMKSYAGGRAGPPSPGGPAEWLTITLPSGEVVKAYRRVKPGSSYCICEVYE